MFVDYKSLVKVKWSTVVKQKCDSVYFVVVKIPHTAYFRCLNDLMCT